jgi:Coenzyme PQQ synthesis protein D (PqqD)
MLAFMAGTAPPVPSDAVIFQSVGDGAVLLHTRDETYYGLNAVGARVWELLPVCVAFDDLCERLGQHYPDVPLDQIRGDVAELLNSLLTSGLVVARA